MKKMFLQIIILFVVLVPTLVLAQQESSIIPDCGKYQACEYAQLIQLVMNIINWVIKIAIPVSAGVFAWAGLTYMMTGVWDKKAQAKKMMLNVVWGFAFILLAWVIVSTVTGVLLREDSGTGEGTFRGSEVIQFRN